MVEKNEIYLKIIHGHELTERENAIVQKEMLDDPGLSFFLDELRKIYQESGDVPKELLDEKRAWNRIEHEIEPEKGGKGVTTVLKWWKYAAVFIGLLVMGYGVFRNSGSENLTKTDKEPGNQIVLQLSDGSTVVLNESEQFSITGTDGNEIMNQDQDELYYKENSGKDIEGEEFNRLTVPYGKRFKIYLSDGTRVHVNSGTTIRYPVTFGKKGLRQIFLEKGEAYFAVVRDENRPFIVNTDRVNVRVLGTEFNVSSYDEDQAVNTVLVNGSVEVSARREGSSGEDGEYMLLSPNEMASFDKSSGKMEVEPVETLNYIAWKDDRMVFIDEPFKEIIKKIERSYGVTVINKNRSLNQARFYGDFDLSKESVEDVLKVFITSKPFDYSIEDDLITIKRKE